MRHSRLQCHSRLQYKKFQVYTRKSNINMKIKAKKNIKVVQHKSIYAVTLGYNVMHGKCEQLHEDRLKSHLKDNGQLCFAHAVSVPCTALE